MKILIVDDHPLLLAGVSDVLRSVDPSIECVQAENAEDALARLAEPNGIDAVCLDLNLPDEDGLTVLSRIRATNETLPVVIFSAVDDPRVVDRALVAGASGYIVKSSSRDELREAFGGFLRRGRYVSPRVRAALDSYRRLEGGVAHAPKLTRRQREVLGLMARGLSNQDIATELGVVESTVKGHVSCLLDLLAAGNRTACVQRAYGLGLIAPGDLADG